MVVRVLDQDLLGIGRIRGYDDVTPFGVISSRKEMKDRKTVDEGNNLSGSRVIIFVVGGITHSEMRVAYELQKAYKREVRGTLLTSIIPKLIFAFQVIVGSTEIITPARFVEQLRSLEGPERALGDY